MRVPGMLWPRLHIRGGEAGPCDWPLPPRYGALQMKIVLEKSDKNRQRHSSSAEREEFLESVEDHQSNDESPEDHCTDSETHAGPSRQHARPSHSSRYTLMWPDSFLAIDPEQ